MNNNFNPGFDREKAAFLELANRGNGLDPINYIYSTDISCESILTNTINAGTIEFYTAYGQGLYIEGVIKCQDLQTITLQASSGTINTLNTNIVKWSQENNDYYVAFQAGDLAASTTWTLPLQDGTNGQVLTTNGQTILSFTSITDQCAPNDANYILQTPNKLLPNAQALSRLIGGILKSSPITGVISIAIPDIDYATVSTLEELAAEASISAKEASASAAEAASSASEATAAAGEATAAGGEAAAAAVEATAAAVKCSLSATRAEIAAGEATAAAATAAISATTAEGAAAEAITAASEATGASTTATIAATTASSSATTAGISATESTTAATASSSSATTAGISAAASSASAAAASVSETNASNSATDAQSYLNTLLTTGLNDLPCTGNVSFAGYQLNNVATPLLPTDGANKAYVDSSMLVLQNLVTRIEALECQKVST
jgi:hypothetical protein